MYCLNTFFTADWAGFLEISAGYCDIETPNNECVTLYDDVMSIKMFAEDTVKLYNTIGLKRLTFRSLNEE